MSARAECLRSLKRGLVETLVRTGLDPAGPLSSIMSLFELSWESGWSAARLAGEWKALLSDPAGFAGIELYLHFPFCGSRCSYCFTNSRVGAAADRIEDCIEDMEREIRYFAPLFEGVPFSVFSVGGGTPSLMTPDQLKRFCAPALERFQFLERPPLTSERLRSIDFNPSSTDPAKVKALKELGFERITLGVQSMNPEVLRRVGRHGQDARCVRAAVEAAKQAGLQVNVDMIFGLVGESVDSFLEGLRRLSELRPMEITISILTPTEAYVRSEGLRYEQHVRQYERDVLPAFERLRLLAEELDYAFPRADPHNNEWWLVDKHHPAREMHQYDWQIGPETEALLGFGRGSRSQLAGRLVYERRWRRFEPESPVYQAARLDIARYWPYWDPEPPTSHLTPVNRKKAMVAFILEALQRRRALGFAPFRTRFGTDLREAFAVELRILEAFGQIELDERGLRYLPQSVPHRMFWALVFALELLADLPVAEKLLSKSAIRELDAALASSGRHG